MWLFKDLKKLKDSTNSITWKVGNSKIKAGIYMKKYSQRGTNIRPYYVLYVYNILILNRVDFITVLSMFTNIIVTFLKIKQYT